MASLDLVPNIGTVFTSRQAYAPVLNAGITGSLTSTAYWWREGQHLNVSGLLAFSGAGGASVNLTVAVPTGVLINTSVLPGGSDATNQGTTMLGYGFWLIQGVGWKFVYPVFNDSTTVAFIENTQVVQTSDFANGDAVKYNLQIPIKGWS